MKKTQKMEILILQGYRPKTMTIFNDFLGKLASNFHVFHGSVVGETFFGNFGVSFENRCSLMILPKSVKKNENFHFLIFLMIFG